MKSFRIDDCEVDADVRQHWVPHATTSTCGSVSFSVANVGTITYRFDLGPASQQALATHIVQLP